MEQYDHVLQEIAHSLRQIHELMQEQAEIRKQEIEKKEQSKMAVDAFLDGMAAGR